MGRLQNDRPRSIKAIAGSSTRRKIYAIGETHTQTVEGFFGLFKNGVRGVYHAISAEYLQAYLDEYAFRYNRRNSNQPMFWAMLNRVNREAPASS